MIICLFPPVFDSRHASIGAIFVGHMDKLPRGPAMQVLWEVTWLSFGVLVFQPHSIQMLQVVETKGGTTDRCGKSQDLGYQA